MFARTSTSASIFIFSSTQKSACRCAPPAKHLQCSVFPLTADRIASRLYYPFAECLSYIVACNKLRSSQFLSTAVLPVVRKNSSGGISRISCKLTENGQCSQRLSGFCSGASSHIRMGDAVYECNYAKLATSSCKKCKTKIEKGALRIAKLVANPYSSTGGDMRQYHHPKCIFDSFVKARATTKIVTEPDDIRGFDDLLEEDQELLSKMIDELVEKKSGKKGTTPKKATPKKGPQSTSSATPKSAGKGEKSCGKEEMDDFIVDDELLDDDMEEDFFASSTPAAKPKAGHSNTAAAAPPKPSAVSVAGSSAASGSGFGASRPGGGAGAGPSFSGSAAGSRPSGGSGPTDAASAAAHADALEKDNSFREYRKLCANIAEDSSYLGKTKVLSTYLEKGTTGSGFKGDVFLLLKLLLPGVIKYVYNLADKQLIKCFSQIFSTDIDEMAEDLEQGDVAETVALFFDKSHGLKPQKKSTLSLKEVDNMLADLAEKTKEDEQTECLRTIAKRCTTNDLKMVIRLIKHDLRINAGAKHILDALDPNAYEAFQMSRDLRDVVNRVQKKNSGGGAVGGSGAAVAGGDGTKGELSKTLSIKAQLMTPIQPMLAEACRSVEQAFSRCPSGMYAEIKYDGERVQLHKQGNQIKYFSRSLKPVQAHKIQHIQDYIKKAFPTGKDLILDCEVLLIDTTTGKPLPFGTLGVHKKSQFKDANVCLFVFDCIHLNGESLLDKPIRIRRKMLMESMTEIPNRILFSEVKIIKHRDVDTLTDLLTKVFSEGLEGLVLKDLNGLYEPGKRHWLKVKKDYLAEGTMADSADLVVLGAYFGSGSKGGMMSVFLMGVYDPDTFRWCTVTKCGNGLDDKIIKKLQKQLDVEKISKDPKKVPPWLNVTKTLLPDFVVKDPKKSVVWEITGAEFTSSNVHTAKGISIRFPRLSKIRDDKSPQQATDLPQLLKLYAGSRRKSDIPDLLEKKKRNRAAQGDDDDDEEEEEEKAMTDDELADEINDDDAMTFSKVLLNKRKAAEAAGAADATDNNGASAAKKSKHEEKATTSKASESPSELPVCRYGPDCYQKNPEHRKKFSHLPPEQNQKKSSAVPRASTSTSTSPASTGPASTGPTPSPLPDIFTGCKFYIPSTVADRDRWVRYIISYDGDVLQDHESSSATHILISSLDQVGDSKSGNARHVTVDWVSQCIRKKKLI